jgi:hypothetical protein
MQARERGAAWVLILGSSDVLGCRLWKAASRRSSGYMVATRRAEKKMGQQEQAC